MYKKISVVLIFILVFSLNIFADNVTRKGKAFFGDNTSIEVYITAVLKSPDTDIRIYAIRQLGKTNKVKALKALLIALRLGVGDVQAYVPQNQEGPVKIRSEAAFALANFSIQKNQILLELRKAMMNDPSPAVQGNAALAMGMLGFRSGQETRKRIVNYLKRKVSRTSKNKTRLVAMVIRAFGINRHPSARLFLNILRSRGYGSIVNREIRRALKRIR